MDLIPERKPIKPLGLVKRVMSFDLIVALMYMKNVIYKMKLLTQSLMPSQLNIIGAIYLSSLLLLNILGIINLGSNNIGSAQKIKIYDVRPSVQGLNAGIS